MKSKKNHPIQQKMISILMPMKNAAKFLDATLATIIQQTYAHWELIAIDDHSTDGSESIIKKYQNKHPNLHLFTNTGKGIIDALKMAYSKSKGEFIHRMDADDLMPEKKLEWMISAWKPNTVVTGMVKYFSEEWMVGGGFTKFEKWINQIIFTEKIWENLYVECPIPSPAWLIHRNDFEKIGRFDSVEIPEDYDLCFRMYEHQIQPVVVKQVIHYWRDSKVRTSRNNLDYFPGNYLTLKIKYFLKLEAKKKNIYLLGNGKKAQKISDILGSENIPFVWFENPEKDGLKKQIIENPESICICISESEAQKKATTALFSELSLREGNQYFWFN